MGSLGRTETCDNLKRHIASDHDPASTVPPLRFARSRVTVRVLRTVMFRQGDKAHTIANSWCDNQRISANIRGEGVEKDARKGQNNQFQIGKPKRPKRNSESRICVVAVRFLATIVFLIGFSNCPRQQSHGASWPQPFPLPLRWT